MRVPDSQEDTSPDLVIRAFEEHDYSALVRVSNACSPDYPTTLEQVRYNDARVGRSHFHLERYVGVGAGGEIVGHAAFGHEDWNYRPHKYWVEVCVHPRHRRRGVGTALWARVLAALHARDARITRFRVRGDQTDALQFFQRRGFVEVMRVWELRLAVATFDLECFQPSLARVLDSGVRITTLANERTRDEGNLHRIYEAEQDISRDVPRPDEYTPISFSTFLDHVVSAPTALSDAVFLAVDNGQYVGLSALFKPAAGDWLVQGLTGVRASFRVRGLATALKVKTVAYARAAGVREVRTWNEVNNAPILAINEKFGFIRQHLWLICAAEM